jgi:quercetin dioxygenase-like cupin family protein|tara:strand:+ start:633 stop:1031 length:399 start_codon:yes stop_codon:yes gene_type:complete
MKILNLILLMFLFNHSNAQEFVSSTDKIEPINEDYDNISITKLSTNSDATTFAIWIKKKVKIHKHINHTEHVYIKQGKGKFQLADSLYNVKTGDLIIVPKNTWHGVIVESRNPMKVISIQSPEFFGKDRVFK